MIRDWKTFREHALKLAKDGYVPVYGDFCTELEEIVLECIEVVREKGHKQVVLLINSTGGANFCYNAIKGALSVSGLKVVGYVIGYALSNAFLTLQLCDKRVATESADLLFHWGWYKLNNQAIASIVKGETWILNHITLVEMIEAEMVSKRTGIPMEQLVDFAIYDRHFTAKEALEKKMLDEVVTGPPSGVDLSVLNI